MIMFRRTSYICATDVPQQRVHQDGTILQTAAHSSPQNLHVPHQMAPQEGRRVWWWEAGRGADQGTHRLDGAEGEMAIIRYC